MEVCFLGKKEEKDMPVGIFFNVLAVVAGGITGAAAGDKISDSFKENLNTVFGACAMAMGISSIVLMENMPAVIFSVIAGTSFGLTIHLGNRINTAGKMMQKGIGRIVRTSGGKHAGNDDMLVTALVLFCASGTGIYGSIVSGMTGEHTILLAKSILDYPTALIFACTLGGVVSLIAIPQLVIFLILFLLANMIYPLCTPAMINDFKACGGILLLATGFRMIRVKEFPIADMIPAMILVMPVSYIWAAYILPLMA